MYKASARLIGQHTGTISAAHFPDLVPEVFVAHHPCQHSAAGLTLHRPALHIVADPAVDDERLVHRLGQRFGVRLRRRAAGLRKSADRQLLTQLLEGILTAVEADGQRRTVQNFGPHGLQPGAQSGKVTLFQLAAQAVIRGNTAASLCGSCFHRVVGSRPGHRKGMALL